MADKFNAKVLAAGTLPNTEGTLYTVPADTRTYIKWFSLFNEDADQQTSLIKVNADGTARAICRAVLDENESKHVVSGGESLSLEAGDLLRGVATLAGAIQYVITGVEEDIS